MRHEILRSSRAEGAAKRPPAATARITADAIAHVAPQLAREKRAHLDRLPNGSCTANSFPLQLKAAGGEQSLPPNLTREAE